VCLCLIVIVLVVLLILLVLCLVFVVGIVFCCCSLPLSPLLVGPGCDAIDAAVKACTAKGVVIHSCVKDWDCVALAVGRTPAAEAVQ
jgi:hypothetical protein